MPLPLSIRFIQWLFIWLCLILVTQPAAARAESARDRFFLMGDGVLHIKNTHTHMEISASLFAPDGSLNEDGLAKIDSVFGLDSGQKGEHISLRLLGMLDYFSDLAARGKTIHLISGYRSPEYNTSLRNAGGNVARTSLHMEGMAIDFYIEGVSGKRLWNLIKNRGCCGIGYYGGDWIHLDSARPRFWEEATSKARTDASEFNRRIYASTTYDRYRPGEAVNLSLTGVSNYGFGISSSAALVNDPEGAGMAATVNLHSTEGTDCLWIGDRDAGRSLSFLLPRDLKPGRYRVRLEFCRRPFEEMPPRTVSNEIEVR
jgi:uncharacterized protein YcbK (DUF882 family)